MARFLSKVAKNLSRLFFGRVIVREMDALRRSEPTRIWTHIRNLDVQPLRAVPRMGTALFGVWRAMKASAAGPLMKEAALGNFTVRAVSLFEPSAFRTVQYKLRIERRAAARAGLARIKETPIARRSRLNFLKNQPKFENARLLALYSPIYQEKVIKSALDKTSGNLLFWYDYDRVRTGEKCHLLLLRVNGGPEPLKWVWLPANKKL